MSPKQWFALLAFYISYLFFGASVFYHFEHKLETDRRSIAIQNQLSLNDLLLKSFKPMDNILRESVLDEISNYCEKSVNNNTEEYLDKPYIWNFYHSFFFSFTVCSTVGYGNISPTNTFGRMFMILYALVGIPVNGILFAYLGEFFGSTFTGLYRRYRMHKKNVDINYKPKQLGLLAQIALYFLPGIVFFIFIPACLFSFFENWNYSISVYYAFVTLSTIGFGDFVPTFGSTQEKQFGIYFRLYQAFIICWFISGLGYLVMVMGFLARGLRSKKIAKLEKVLASNIRDRNDRLWHNMQKDRHHLLKLFSELYLLKYKAYEQTYISTQHPFQKSESCPDILEIQKYQHKSMRRRAFSDATEIPPMYKSRSDGDLQLGNSIIRSYVHTMISDYGNTSIFEDFRDSLYEIHKKQMSDMIAKVQHYNEAVNVHTNQQSLNPFSTQQTGRRSPRLELSPSEYGKPKSGSLTEMRGFKANVQVFKDILELCEVIASEGKPYNKEGLKMILFGELFQIYTKINDKLVGILIRGRRHQYLNFDGEMLYQRKDDMIPIYLIKSINDIRTSINEKQKEIQKQINDSSISSSDKLL